MNTERANYISFLRCVAILLITNSHINHLYPASISQLATGGAMGNALFFMLSGYGLALSKKSINIRFLPWYKRRVARIYPSLTLATLFIVFIPKKAWFDWTIFDYIYHLIWPTHAWFISALMIFYIVSFFLLKKQNHNLFIPAILALVIPYLIFYFTIVDLSHYSIEGAGYFKWLFYLQTMLFGAYLAHREDLLNKNSFLLNGITLILLILLYYSFLLLIDRGYGSKFQFLTHILMFAIIYFFLKLSYSKFVSGQLMNLKYFGTIVSLIASLTLEMYLLQGTVYSLAFLKTILFPLNIIVFFTILLALSFILNKIAHFITSKLIHA